MLADAKNIGLIKITNRYWKLLGSLYKPKRSIAFNRFVFVVRLKSSLFNIHEVIAADRYNLDSFLSPLDLAQSSVSLHIIERQEC